VLGKVFWSGAAAALAQLGEPALEQALHSLERKGLIRRERRSAVRGEDEYAFRHVLVRDVAYGQIPRADRGNRHVAAAAWLEGLGRVDDHAELVAYHYGAALELARAVGEVDESLGERARHAFRRAGDRALRLNAFPAAERFFAEALALWPDEPARAAVAYARARARYYAEGDAGELEAALAALEAAGDNETAAEAAVLMAHAAWRSGRTSEAPAMLVRARALVGQTRSSPALAATVAESARLAAFDGRVDDAVALSEEALGLVEELGLEELRASVLNTLGVVRLMNGDLREAISLKMGVVEMAAVRGTEHTRALTNLCVTFETDGFMGEAERYALRAVESATRNGDKAQLLWLESSRLRAQVYGEGDWAEALDGMGALLQTFTALGGHYLEPGIRSVRAGILAGRDEVDAALEDIDFALRLLEGRSDAQTMVPTNMECAHALIILGDVDRARGLVDAAIPHIEKSHHRAPGVTADNAATVVRVGRTDWWLRRHETSFAEVGRVWAAYLMYSGRAADAADLYEHIAWPAEAAAARLLAAEQLVAAGRRAEADVQLQGALGFYRRAGAKRIVRQAEALLAAAS
jgi:tetratricopeptide (TPR) repeat protein